MSYSNSGTVTLTADGVIGISGEPVRIYSVYWIKGTGTDAMQIDSGTSASGTNIISHTSVASTGNFLDLGREGILFPEGAFYDEGANITSATITFRVES